MATDLITVLIDTREQRPFSFDHSRFTTQRATMRTGDYTVLGLEKELVIERKNLGDFVGTVIGDWLRFKKELIRMAAFDTAAIVVEANLDDVFARRYESDAEPSSIIGRANAIHLDFGVPVLWWGPRTGCVVMLESYLELAVKKTSGIRIDGATGNRGPSFSPFKPIGKVG